MLLYWSGKVEIGRYRTSAYERATTKMNGSNDGGEFNQIRWDSFLRYHVLGRGR